MTIKTAFLSVSKYLGVVLVVVLACLVILLHDVEPNRLYEASLLLAVLNSLLLGLMPLCMAYLAAKSYQASGATGFLWMGCGLVFFSLGSLFAGWIMPMMGEPDPAVTLHNLGAFLAGLCQLVGGHLFIQDVFGLPGDHPSTRQLAARRWRPDYPILYAGALALVVLLALLVYLERVPAFFDPYLGPSSLRQLVLGAAFLLFAAAGLVFIEIYAIAKTKFAAWYGLGLLLVAVGLAGVLQAHAVNSLLSWVGRTGQYLGAIYLGIAFLQGHWEWEHSGTSRAELKPNWVFWPYMERLVRQRTSALAQANAALQAKTLAYEQAQQELQESRKFLETINQMIPDVVYLYDVQQQKHVYFNRELGNLLGYSNEEILALGGTAKLLSEVHPEDLPRVMAHIQRMAVIEDDRQHEVEYRMRAKDGSVRWFYAREHVYQRDAARKPLSVFGILQDISRRKEVEETLRDHEIKLLTVFDTMEEGLALNELVYDAQGEIVDYRILEVNPAFERITGCPREQAVGKLATQLYQTHSAEINAFWKIHLSTGQAIKSDLYRPEAGRWQHVSTSAPLEGKFVTLFFDNTEQKIAELALLESEASLKFAQRVAHLGNWTWDTRTNRVTWSDEMFRVFGRNPDTFNGDLAQIIAESIHPDDREAVNRSNQRVLEDASPQPIEYRVIWPDGTVHTVWAEAGEKELDENRQVVRLSGIVQDITDRKRVEQELARSLAEKEALLRELHHRTKNNMAVIIALLELQAQEVDDPQLTKAFLEARNRIRSMSLVHEKLYATRDLSQINLKDYIYDLVWLLLESYNVSPEQAEPVFKMDDVLVLIDSAIPCGLVVNELVSNILKYAFPEGCAGPAAPGSVNNGATGCQIRVSLAQAEDGEIDLLIGDNGVGVPPGFDFRRDGHLGMQTIFILGENQLQGQVIFDTTSPGVSCLVRFKDIYYQARI